MRSTTTAPALRVLLGLLAAIVALPLHALETLIGLHYPETRGYDLVLRAVLSLLPYELLPGISRRLLPAAYADVQWRFDTEIDSRAVALTVDDWPGDDLARGLALLAVLKQHSVRATFFVTSSACGCATGRKLMAAACAAGHQLCNHLPEDRLVRPTVAVRAASSRDTPTVRMRRGRGRPGGAARDQGRDRRLRRRRAPDRGGARPPRHSAAAFSTGRRPARARRRWPGKRARSA